MEDGFDNILPKIKAPSEYKHLRPISVLPVLSKVLERSMCFQIRNFIDRYQVLPATQSGFRPFYSCTTALLKVSDDIIRSVDSGDLTLLVLLDFSRAFDTVRHDILLSILKYLHFSSDALSLLESYFSGRSQRVRVGDQLSQQIQIKAGVPQGSILGPLLFTIYTSQLEKHIRFSKLHIYADDTQLYYSFKPEDVQAAVAKLNADLQSVAQFSTQMALKLNPQKSAAILFGSEADCERVIRDSINLHINDIPIPLEQNVKNLGLLMDNSFRFRVHISSCLKRAYGTLKLLFPHRSFFSVKLKLHLCESLVLSQFNYCSQVFSPCLDSVTLNRVQRLQNSCLRFSYGIRKYQHISYKLQDAKWLNMKNKLKTTAYMSVSLRFRAW